MLRSVAIAVFLAASPACLSVLCAAEAAKPAHHVRRGGVATKAATAPTAGGINSPATDFSKIERSDEDGSNGSSGPTVHPVIGAGGMGFGTGF